MSFDFLYVSLNCFVALLSTQMHSSEIQLFRFRSNKIWHAFTCIQNSCTVREITAFSPHSSVLMPSLNHSLEGAHYRKYTIYVKKPSDNRCICTKQIFQYIIAF